MKLDSKGCLKMSVLFAAAPSLLAGCVVTPSDGGEYDALKSQRWDGTVMTANEVVRIEASRHAPCAAGFARLAEARAADTPTTVNGSDLFQFAVEVPPFTSPNNCLMVSPFGCQDLDAYTHGQIRARGIAHNPLTGEEMGMFTFTEEARENMMDELIAGTPVGTAAINNATGTEVRLDIRNKTSTWAFDIDRLKVIQHEESGSIFKAAGDEPELIVLPFRFRAALDARSLTVSNVVVGWNGVVRTLGDTKTSGSILDVADDNGRVHFTNVKPTPALAALGGAPFDVLGVTVTGIEHDSTDASLIRRIIRDSLPSIEASLASEFSGRSNLAAAMEEAMQPVPTCDDLDASGGANDLLDDVSLSFGEFLENALEALVGAGDDDFGMQLRLWMGLDFITPDLALTCPQARIRALEPTSSDFATPGFDFTEDGVPVDKLSGSDGHWRAETRFFNWTDELVSGGATACGENPYLRFGDSLPQALSATQYRPRTAVPGTTGVGRPPID